MATYTVQVEDEVIDGHNYDAECEVYAHSESNYGADADGHRGGYMEFVDDVVILSCSKDGKDIDPKTLPEKIYDKITDIAGEKEIPDDVEL